MTFSKKLKTKVKEKSHYRCCFCQDHGTIGILEIHHIIPQAVGGPDTEDNAAPLCPTHHEMYGNDPKKRKMIKEVRDFWYKQCEDKSQKNIPLNNLITKEDFDKFKEEIFLEISNSKKNRLIQKIKEKIKSFFEPSSVEITYAKLFIREQQYSEAIEQLTIEIQNNPQSYKGYYLLGYIYGEQGRIYKMLKCFSKSIKINSKFEVSINNSKKYYWADNLNKGVAAFNKAVDITETVKEKKLLKSAVIYFKYAILCKSDSSDTYKNLAYTYINMGNRDAAIEPYKKVVELSNEASAYVQLGDLYLQKGLVQKQEGDTTSALASFDSAIEVLEKGRAQHPNDGDILLLLSNSYIAAGKFEIAKEAFKAGVEKEPENKFYRYNYGSLLLNAKEYAEAAEHLEKALEIDPDYENAIYNLAVTYVKWGADLREKMEEENKESDEYKTKFEAALPLLEKYLQINEKDGVVWDLLGKVYANLVMVDKSKEAFEKSDRCFNVITN